MMLISNDNSEKLIFQIFIYLFISFKQIFMLTGSIFSSACAGLNGVLYQYININNRNSIYIYTLHSTLQLFISVEKKEIIACF